MPSLRGAPPGPALSPERGCPALDWSEPALVSRDGQFDLIRRHVVGVADHVSIVKLRCGILSETQM